MFNARKILVGLCIAAFVAVGVPSTIAGQALPPKQPNLVVNGKWACVGPQNRDSVKVFINNPLNDAVSFGRDCSGFVGLLEVEGVFADCVKIQRVAPVAHDLVVNGGYCRDFSTSSDHKDGVQAMSGRNIFFNNFAFDVGTPTGGTGGGHYFIAGSTANIICDHCAFGPRMNNQIRTTTDPTSGVKNSRVCQSYSGRKVYVPSSADMGGNHSPAANSAECQFENLLAYVRS